MGEEEEEEESVHTLIKFTVYAQRCPRETKANEKKKSINFFFLLSRLYYAHFDDEELLCVCVCLRARVRAFVVLIHRSDGML